MASGDDRESQKLKEGQTIWRLGMTEKAKNLKQVNHEASVGCFALSPAGSVGAKRVPQARSTLRALPPAFALSEVVGLNGVISIKKEDT